MEPSLLRCGRRAGLRPIRLRERIWTLLATFLVDFGWKVDELLLNLIIGLGALRCTFSRTSETDR